LSIPLETQVVREALNFSQKKMPVCLKRFSEASCPRTVSFIGIDRDKNRERFIHLSLHLYALIRLRGPFLYLSAPSIIDSRYGAHLMLKVCDVFKEKELKMALCLLGITQSHVDEAEDRTRFASPQVRLNLA
jgi:hypothetical protein